MPHRFSLAIRLLHWTMALLIIAMLFIGAGMVSTAGPAYASLIALHRPLGIAILLLAALRLVLRVATGAPPLPADLPPRHTDWKRVGAGNRWTERVDTGV